MFELLRAHVEKFVQINDDDFEGIIKYFTTQSIAKKENLVEEGQICRHHYFVLQGMLRKFFVDERGVEHTTEFAIEHWWLTDNIAFEHKLPTTFYIQAVEASSVLSIGKEDQERLLEEFPAMERYFRFVYQRAYGAAQMRIKYLFEFSKEQFYLSMKSKYPEFIQRVPQYLIASYLNFTPEYLSEIRKKSNG